MNKRIRTLTAAAAALFCLGAAIPAHAAETTGNAYIFLRDVAEDGVRYEGPDAMVNTIRDGVTSVLVDTDGSYTVGIDLTKESAYETVDEISKLQLYVIGPPSSYAANVTVDSVKINGEEIALTWTPQVKISDNVFYADICDANGDSLFNRTDYIKNITSVEIGFTVSNWITETVPATTAPPKPARMAAKSVPTEAEAPRASANDTADPSSISLIAAMLSCAALLGFATYRKD
jgi:hypothetical protein